MAPLKQPRKSLRVYGTRNRRARRNTSTNKEATWHDLSRMPVPDDHTSLDAFELEGEPYRVGDDILVNTYTSHASERVGNCPARIVAITRSNGDGAINLKVAWYYSCGDVKTSRKAKARLRTLQKEPFYIMSNHFQYIDSTTVNGRVTYNDWEEFHVDHVLVFHGRRNPTLKKSSDMDDWWGSNVQRCPGRGGDDGGGSGAGGDEGGEEGASGVGVGGGSTGRGTERQGDYRPDDSEPYRRQIDRLINSIRKKTNPGSEHKQ